MNVAGKFVGFLSLFLFIHVGLTFGQSMGVFVLTGGADYGESIISGTPIDGLLSFSRITSIFNVREIFTALGSTLTGLFGMAVFSYDMLVGHSGAAAWVIGVLRMVMSVATSMVTITIGQTIFSSGIFSSTAGIALVIGTVGVGTLVTTLLGG